MKNPFNLSSLGGLMGQLSGGSQQNNLLGAAAQIINGSKIGGLGGLATLFNKQGYGNKMASWVSTGENDSISPQQVETALGHENVQEIASKAGVSEQEASQGLSGLLPQLIDKLTPDGKLPEGESGNHTLSQIADRFQKH